MIFYWQFLVYNALIFLFEPENNSLKHEKHFATYTDGRALTDVPTIPWLVMYWVWVSCPLIQRLAHFLRLSSYQELSSHWFSKYILWYLRYPAGFVEHPWESLHKGKVTCFSIRSTETETKVEICHLGYNHLYSCMQIWLVFQNSWHQSLRSAH